MRNNPIWKLVRDLACFVAGIPLVLLILWVAGALLYDLPLSSGLRLAISLCWLVGALGAWFFSPRRLAARTVVLIGSAGVVGWWLTLQPASMRDWKPEVAVLARAEIKDDVLTIQNVRNFDYQAAEVFTPRYEDRTYDLRQLRGVDIFLSTWGSNLMGHPIVSFDFGSGGHLAFSIEIRPEKNERFDPIGSLYRKFELIYIPADERDVVRVRTNFRTTEEVFLYRVAVPPETARIRLGEYVARLNELHGRPEWYNVVTANCTTSIRAQRPRAQRLPWDWRILFNGRADEMLYDQGGIDQALTFAELKRRSHINSAARAAGDAPDFSARIRQGLPGFE